MRTKLNKKTLRAYTESWGVANQFEKDQLRKTSFQQKLKELGSLMALGNRLGWKTKSQVNVVRERWRKLRKQRDRG